MLYAIIAISLFMIAIIILWRFDRTEITELYYPFKRSFLYQFFNFYFLSHLLWKVTINLKKGDVYTSPFFYHFIDIAE